MKRGHTMSNQTLELLCQQVHQAHRNAVAAELAKRGLSEIGHPMLMTILKSSEESKERYQAQRDLAELLHISPAAVANSLKSLERGGYIHREPDKGDARCNRVLLTEKGHEAVEECRDALASVSKRMLAGFSQEEQEQLVNLRKRMLWNLRGESPEQKEES